MIMQFLVMPMFFLSGAIFPLRNLPTWMDILSKLNPASYAIDSLRQIVFRFIDIPEIIVSQFKFTLFSAPISLTTDLLLVGGFGILMVILAVFAFNRSD